MSGTRTLLFVVLCALAACAESVEVPEDAAREAGTTPDAAPPGTSPTIARVSDEIDLAAVDDRAMGFRETAAGLVAESTHAARVTALGVTLGINGAPVALGHARVATGGEPIPLGAPDVDADAHATRDGANVHEVIESRAATIAQSWRFATRPNGAIEVRVPIPGATLDRVDAAGLHLVLGDARFVYSHARFVDARGAASDVEARFEDGEVVLRVDATLVSLTEFPAVLDPTIGPEITLAGAVSIGRDPTAAEQAPSLALIDGRAMAVWTASSTLRCNYAEPSETSPVRALRSLGTVSSTPPLQTAVAGSTGLVMLDNASSLTFVRFDASCNALDASARSLFGAASTLEHVAGHPGGFVAAWTTSSTAQIRAIGLDGGVLWTAPATLSDTFAIVSSVRLLPTPTEILVVYRTDNGSLRARRLSHAGAWIDTSPVVLDAGGVTANPARLSVARGDGTIAMYWVGGSAPHTLATFDATTLMRLVTAPGTAMPDAVASEHPLLAFDGTRYAIAYAESVDRRVRIYPLDVATLDALGPPIVSPFSGFAVEPLPGFVGDAHGFVASARVTAAPSDVDAYVFRADGTAIDVSQLTVTETWPAVASSGTGFLATWVRATPEPRARAVYVSDGGALSPATGFDLSTDTIGNVGAYRGDVAATPTHYLTQWSVTGDHGRLFTPGSTVGSDAHWGGISAKAVMAVEVAGVLHTAYVSSFDQVVWRTAASPTNDTGTYGSLTVPVGRPWTAARNVAAVAGTSAINLATMSGAASTLSVAATQVALAYASTPDQLLLVYAASNGAISGRRLSTSAALLGSTIPIRASAASPATSLSVVWNGQFYVVAYVVDGDLSMRRFDATGAAIDATPAPIALGVAGSVPTDMAADAMGKVMIVYAREQTMDGTQALRVRGRIVDFVAPGPDPNGTACTNGWGCASGRCVDGVCCDTACDAACDACSIAAGGSQDGVCTPRGSGVECRPSAGPCDVAESCDGTNAACPTNVFANGTTCAGSNGSVCDAPDVCDGTTSACPARYAPVGTTCRDASAACDLAETCTGLGTACPSDAIRPGGASCRDSVGDCDVAETCNGFSKLCPSDGYRPSWQTCRASASSCDAAESCTGTSATCPADAPHVVGVACRGAASACDGVETCDGTSFDCPPDGPAPVGQTCRSSFGPCDAIEQCDGTSFDCPPDLFAPSGTICRGAASGCDAPEQCSGLTRFCPNDRVRPAGHVCRTAAGGCDAPEICDGANSACPPDRIRPNGYVCRAALGPCDIAELCTGDDSECLHDVHNVDGTSCDDGLVCNGTATCEAGACVAREPIACEDDEVCSEATRRCIPPGDDGGGGGCATMPSREAAPSTTAPFVLIAAALGLVRRRHR